MNSNEYINDASAAYLVNDKLLTSSHSCKGGEPVQVGFKWTESGMIPEDWNCQAFGDVLTIKHGKNQKLVECADGLYPILASGGEIGRASSYLYNKPSVLIGRKGTIDKPRFIDCPFWTVDTLFYSEIKPKAEPKYVYYQFCMVNWREYNEASGVPSLNASTIERVLCAFPAKAEQTAIVNVLSDIDELINSIELLIAKKQAIKTATMQQLLTGRTRLPQFAHLADGITKGNNHSELGETNLSGTNLDADIGGPLEVSIDSQCIPMNWLESEIGEFAPLQRGFDLPSGQRNDGKYPVVYSNGIANTHDQFQVKGPGVVTGRSGTLGKVHFVDSDYWPHNTSLWVTKFYNSDPKFVYFLFTYIGFERFASGSGVPTLNRNDAHSFKVLIPSSKEEQIAIATILSDMIEEIQTLEQRLSKTRQLKRGMMQELLTGKTRLL